MEIDWNLVRSRFAGMSREELLEETALRADDYEPAVRLVLEGEALARGITSAQIQALRQDESPPVETDGIELPALITSSDEKGHIREFVELLRERGIPAEVRELDPKQFHASGHRVGRWGLMVAGCQVADAVRLLESTFPSHDEAAVAAGCGGGCCPGDGGGCESTGEEWSEDGDWWKTVPGEVDPHEERG